MLANGTLVWNRFHYIGDDIQASSIKKWKNQSPHILFRWICLLRRRMIEANIKDNEIFELPNQNDKLSLLMIICRGSPKIRITLRILAELVVLQKKKVIFWCSLPANQLLIHACCELLNIWSGCYSSELTREERNAVVHAFTEDPEKRVFIGSWHVGSTGLNLQKQCYHCIEWDAPPSIGAMIQARGRSRRIGQPLAVENLEVTVENSFQNRIMRTTIMKSLPGAMAHLTINVGEVNDSFATGNDDDDIEIGEWFLVDGELIQKPDPRVDNLPANLKLTTTQFLTALMDSKRGGALDSDIWEDEKVDDEFLLSDIEVVHPAEIFNF
uniref:Helicase C-terminal domain-containing protein n=1 Tax=Oidiodendron maius (strain Zn) TaxID=913774 RepID=A0A0C3D2P8_OIDMZ|nr:hypothetical protein OIDMADRAFT_23938 [Oidiodendron maius Zn]